jgi:hypothetical protein
MMQPFLEADNVPVLPWHAYSPDMSPIEHVWYALDQRVWHRVPVPVNIQQLHTATEDEWDNIPQATINSLINSMQRRCVALHETHGGHTRYWLVFWSTPLTFFKRYMWPRDAYLYSHLCKIHRLGPDDLFFNWLISLYELWNCCMLRFIFLFSVNTDYNNTREPTWGTCGLVGTQPAGWPWMGPAPVGPL